MLLYIVHVFWSAPLVEWFRYFDHYFFRPPHKYKVGPSLFVLIDNLTTLVCLTHTTFNSVKSSESVLVTWSGQSLWNWTLLRAWQRCWHIFVTIRFHWDIFYQRKKRKVWQKVSFLLNRQKQNGRLLEYLDKSPAPQLAKLAVCAEQKGDSNWNLKSW